MLTEPGSPAPASRAAGWPAAACWRVGDVTWVVWAVPVRPSAVRPQVSAVRVAAQRWVVSGSELAQRAAPGLRASQVQADAAREHRVSRGISPAEGEAGPAQASAEVAGDRVVRRATVRPPGVEIQPLASAEAQRSKRQAAVSVRQPRVVLERSAFAVPRVGPGELQ